MNEVSFDVLKVEDLARQICDGRYGDGHYHRRHAKREHWRRKARAILALALTSRATAARVLFHACWWRL